jgi:hypothetical protein
MKSAKTKIYRLLDNILAKGNVSNHDKVSVRTLTFSYIYRVYSSFSIEEQEKYKEAISIIETN